MNRDVSPSRSSHLDESTLTAELQTALRETVFSSGLTISPKRLNGIAKDLARSFYVYVADNNYPAVVQFGQSLAVDGLAPRSVVSVTDKLRVSTANASDSMEMPSGIATDFCAALLIGFMEGREQIILREAERTHRAYLAAMNLR